MAMMEPTLPRMAGVSGPRKKAQENCIRIDSVPTKSASVMFFITFVRSVIIRMMKGVM